MEKGKGSGKGGKVGLTKPSSEELDAMIQKLGGCPAPSPAPGQMRAPPSAAASSTLLAATPMLFGGTGTSLGKGSGKQAGLGMSGGWGGSKGGSPIKEEPVDEASMTPSCSALLALPLPEGGEASVAEPQPRSSSAPMVAKKKKRAVVKFLVPQSNSPYKGRPVRNKKLVSRNGPKVRGPVRQRVWPSGIAGQSGDCCAVSTFQPHRPDGRTCQLCPAKDTDADSVVPTMKTRWMKPYDRKTGKTRGMCCYYCYVNYRSRYVAKGKNISLEQLRINAGNDSKVHEENQEYRKKVVEKKKEEYEAFLAAGGDCSITDECTLTEAIKATLTTGKRTRFEAFTQEREREMARHTGFGLKLSLKDDWWELADYLPKLGDPRTNQLGHTIAKAFGRIGVIVKRGGPSGEISRDMWDGFDTKEEVMGSNDQIQDSDMDTAMEELRTSWFANHRATGYSMDEICGSLGGGHSALSALNGLGPLAVGAPSAAATSAAAASGNSAAADDGSFLAPVGFDFGTVVDSSLRPALPPYGQGEQNNQGEQNGKTVAAPKAGGGKRPRKGGTTSTAQQPQQQPQGQGVQPLPDAGADKAGGQSVAQAQASVHGAEKATENDKKEAVKKGRGRPKKDPVKMANTFIDDFQTAQGPASNLFCGAESKTTASSLETTLKGLDTEIKDKNTPPSQLTELNSLHKKIQVIKAVCEAYKQEHSETLGQNFWSVVSTQQHFLKSPPVEELSFPAFLEKKRIEFLVLDAGLDPAKLVAALSLGRLESAGYKDADAARKFQLQLLLEVAVVLARDHDPLLPALETLFGGLATLPGISAENQKEIELINRMTKYKQVTVEGAASMEEALVSAHRKDSIASALAMFQPGRDFLAAVRRSTKSLSTIAKAKAAVNRICKTIEDMPGERYQPVVESFCDIQATLAPLDDETMKIFVNDDEFKDRLEAVVSKVISTYGRGALQVMRPLLDETKDLSTWVIDEKEAWSEYRSLGKKLKQDLPVRFLGVENDVAFYRRCISDPRSLVSKSACIAELEGSEVGTGQRCSAAAALFTYHWAHAIMPTFLNLNSDFMITVDLKEEDDDYIKLEKVLKVLASPERLRGILKHAYAYKTQRADSFLEKVHSMVIKISAGDASKTGTDASRCFPALTQIQKIPPEMPAKQLPAAMAELKASRAFLQRGKKLELGQQEKDDLLNLACLLGETTLANQVLMGDLMISFFSAMCELMETLCEKKIESRDTWSITQTKVDLLTKVEERMAALRKTAGELDPKDVVSEEPEVLHGLQLSLHEKTQIMIAAGSDLTSRFRRQWKGDYDALLTLLEQSRPRPQLSSLLTDRSQAALLLSRSTLQLPPIANAMQDMLKVLTENKQKFSLVSESDIAIASDHVEKSNQILGVAFTLYAMTTDLCRKETPEAKWAFKQALKLQASQKSFVLPQCISEYLDTRNTDDDALKQLLTGPPSEAPGEKGDNLVPDEKRDKPAPGKDHDEKAGKENESNDEEPAQKKPRTC